MLVPPPPKLDKLLLGTRLMAGLNQTTVLADFDFETYSEAGYVWDSQLNKFTTLTGARKKVYLR